MTDPKTTRASLARLIALTRTEEIDCDGFSEHLAALIEGNVEPELETLLEHHRSLCPECDEERDALARALGDLSKGET